MDPLTGLKDWYAAQCDGAWEHAYGITLSTVDNPGWVLRVELTGTALQGRAFVPLRRGDPNAGGDWLDCKVEAGSFVAAGGTDQLAEIVGTFLAWARA